MNLTFADIYLLTGLVYMALKIRECDYHGITLHDRVALNVSKLNLSPEVSRLWRFLLVHPTGQAIYYMFVYIITVTFWPFMLRLDQNNTK
jgi:hypothetical protein